MKMKKINQLLMIIGLGVLTMSVAKAEVKAYSVNLNTNYQKNWTNSKAADIGDALLDNQLNWGLLKTILINWEDMTPTERRNALRKIDAIEVSKRYDVYPSAGNQPNATVSTEPGVAIGSGSDYPFDKDGSLDLENVGGDTIAGQKYKYAGDVVEGLVTIGNASRDEQRAIVNVAAGRVYANSTDAVNGSQLYASNQAIEKLYKRIQELENTIKKLENR